MPVTYTSHRAQALALVCTCILLAPLAGQPMFMCRYVLVLSYLCFGPI
jgi:hypothetical protein